MYFEYYRTVKDYNKNNMLFSREEKHWWLTGFKMGWTAGEEKSVLKATLIAYDDKMADGIEAIWHNKKADAFRRQVMAQSHSIPICRECNY